MGLILLVLVILLVLGGGGFGTYHAYNTWGPGYGFGSVAGILIVLLLVWLLFGGIR